MLHRYSCPLFFGRTIDKLEQQFNGLGWRTWKHADSLPRNIWDDELEVYFTEEEDGVLDETHVYTYNASWQLLEERIDATLEGVDDRVVQHVWGLRYIDDPVLHRRDVDNDGVFTESGEGVFYHLTDAMFSTVALVDLEAKVVERVTYDPYGRPLHHTSSDLNGDSAVTSTGTTPALNDLKAITNNNSSHGPIYWNSALGGSNSYSGVGDLNRDGAINNDDLVAWLVLYQTGLFPGSLSSVDNVAGFDGYIYDSEVGMYMVRRRSYEPTLGCWLSRDPIGYPDGPNAYSYVVGVPTMMLDPTGTKLRVDYPNQIPEKHRGFWEVWDSWVSGGIFMMCPDVDIDEGTGRLRYNGPPCPASLGCKCLKELIENGHDNVISAPPRPRLPVSKPRLPGGIESPLPLPPGIYGPPSPGPGVPGRFMFTPEAWYEERHLQKGNNGGVYQLVPIDAVFFHELCGHILEFNHGRQLPVESPRPGERRGVVPIPGVPQEEAIPIEREQEYRRERGYPRRPVEDPDGVKPIERPSR